MPRDRLKTAGVALQARSAGRRTRISVVGAGALRLSARTGVGLIIVFLFFVAAIGAPWLAPYDPAAINLDRSLEGPSWAHPFGLDSSGADILSRILYGARVSLLVGVLCVALSAWLGVLYGAFSAMAGAAMDRVLMAIVDIVLAFPGFLLALALAAFLGQGIENVVLAIAVVGWVPYARITRAEVLSLRRRDFVLAARASGASEARVFFRHMLPNTFNPILIQATFGMAGAIVVEGSLSFLGLGVPATTPSWGSMLASGKNYILVAQHPSLLPGLSLMILVIGLNFLGDGLRDALDPKERPA